MSEAIFTRSSGERVSFDNIFAMTVPFGTRPSVSDDGQKHLDITLNESKIQYFVLYNWIVPFEEGRKRL